MDRQTQIAMTRRVLDRIAARETEFGDAVFLNPVSTYTSPEQAERERRRLFRETPLLLGLGCQIPNPGDWLTEDLSGTPILAVRGEDGSVRAFLNVCRHRGAKVATGCGSGAKSFACPYHGWTYGLDGRLLRVIPRDAFEGITCEARSLVPLPVAERHGMIWVRPSPGPDFDVDEMLGGLGPELEAYGLAGYSHYQSALIRKPMNWKLVIDTFLETWHVAVLHRNTISPIFQPGVATFDAFGRNARMVLPRRSIADLADVPESEWEFLKHTAIVYLLFPNTVLIWQGDHLETWRSFPVGGRTDECVTETALFTPEPATTDSARRHWDRNMDLLLRTVEEEDFPQCVDMQRGFGTAAQAHITFGRNEPGLTHYHRGIQAAVGE